MVDMRLDLVVWDIAASEAKTAVFCCDGRRLLAERRTGCRRSFFRVRCMKMKESVVRVDLCARRAPRSAVNADKQCRL